MQKIDKTDTLGKILSGRRFTVDYFQREYRWGQKQIDRNSKITRLGIF